MPRCRTDTLFMKSEIVWMKLDYLNPKCFPPLISRVALGSNLWKKKAANTLLSQFPGKELVANGR